MAYIASHILSYSHSEVVFPICEAPSLTLADASLGLGKTQPAAEVSCIAVEATKVPLECREAAAAVVQFSPWCLSRNILSCSLATCCRTQLHKDVSFELINSNMTAFSCLLRGSSKCEDASHKFTMCKKEKCKGLKSR